MKLSLALLAIAACLGLNGCATTSPQADNYESLSQPTGSVATTGPSGGAGTGAAGAAYDLALTAVGAAAVPGYLDKQPVPPYRPADANNEPYPR